MNESAIGPAWQWRTAGGGAARERTINIAVAYSGRWRKMFGVIGEICSTSRTGRATALSRASNIIVSGVGGFEGSGGVRASSSSLAA